MDIHAEFATDEKLEIEGRWVDYDEKTSFKIARANNKEFARLFTREYELKKALLTGRGEAAEKASEKLIIEVMAKTILLGWNGPVKIKGAEVAYSAEAAQTVLGYKEFRRWVSNHSENFEAFRVAQAEEEAKN